MSEDDPVRLDIRLSGQLHRYHTWPIIGQQTIASHCWQLLRIYCCVVDQIDPHMVLHITYHDIGETFTGDIPYPVKSENPKLKEQIDRMEEISRCQQLGYWNAFRQILLSDEDKKLFKDIEIIEMAEFGLDQMCLGNSHAFIIADRCLRKVYKNHPCERLVLYVVKRIDLFCKQYKNTIIEPLGDWWLVSKWEKLLEEETHDSK
jgi:5'-deoxynucleotidase YfbR-like HD superfamily hydrolase